MTIEINEQTVGTWFVALPSGAGHDNWMAALSEISEGQYELRHRFRYCDPLEPGADAFEDLDRKVWYRGTYIGTRDGALASIRKLAAGLAEAAGTKADEILMGPDGPEAFMATLVSKPWAQMQTVGASA